MNVGVVSTINVTFILFPQAKETYFKRAMTKDNLGRTRVPQFYGIYKVHKNSKPTPPIVSSVNSIPKIISNWVDYWLKKVVGTIHPTHIPDVNHLMNRLCRTFPNDLPSDGARLIWVEAIGMYSNVDTKQGNQVLCDYDDNLHQCMPVNYIIEAMAKSMQSSIFQFGNTFWKQTLGCAMDTSTAVKYGYLYISLLEVKCFITATQPASHSSKNLLIMVSQSSSSNLITASQHRTYPSID
jgi:hypothetical protein